MSTDREVEELNRAVAAFTRRYELRGRIISQQERELVGVKAEAIRNGQADTEKINKYFLEVDALRGVLQFLTRAAQVRKARAEQLPIDDVLHDLIGVWHDAEGIDGILLHQFLGCTEQEYAAWFGPDPKPLPERVHGYWRWLHARSVTP